jgi:hypothetical protein
MLRYRTRNHFSQQQDHVQRGNSQAFSLWESQLFILVSRFVWECGEGEAESSEAYNSGMGVSEGDRWLFFAGLGPLEVEEVYLRGERKPGIRRPTRIPRAS